MAVRIPVKPALMHWAVERAGKHPRDFNEDEQQWISGERPPTVRQLKDLAHKLHVPFGYLLLEQPPQEQMPLPDFRTRKNKVLGEISVDLRDVIYQYQRQQDWFRDYMLRNDLDPIPAVKSITHETPILEAAELIRQQLQLDAEVRATFKDIDDARKYLIESLESLGVLVAVSGIVGSNTHRPLDPEEFGGFALVDEFAPLIFVNGADHKTAQIFTLIHEFVHIMVGDEALTDGPTALESDEHHERWCNSITAEVLVPSSELLNLELPHDPIEAAEFIARQYCVGRLVALRRLYEINHINWDIYSTTYDSLFKAIPMHKEKKSTGGEYYNTQFLRLGRRFTRALLSDTLEGSTSYRDAFQLLRSHKISVFEKMITRLEVR